MPIQLTYYLPPCLHARREWVAVRQSLIQQANLSMVIGRGVRTNLEVVQPGRGSEGCDPQRGSKGQSPFAPWKPALFKNLNHNLYNKLLL